MFLKLVIKNLFRSFEARVDRLPLETVVCGSKTHLLLLEWKRTRLCAKWNQGPKE